MTDNQYLLIACRKLIEETLEWGDSSNWKSQDFENLSEQIFQKTHVVLSASTLKRIWGKVRYESTPQLSTLDALARFLDYPTWRDFVRSYTQQDRKKEQRPLTKRPKPYALAVILAMAICIVILGLVFRRPGQVKLEYTDIRFTSSPVTMGVPNTVVFQYDATHSNADSVFIQQNWDARRRFKVDKDKHEYASTYYMPGYYRAKLILNDSIVSEHDVFIESQQWIGLFMGDPVPHYLADTVYDHGDWWGLRGLDAIPDSYDYKKPHPPFVLTKVSKEWGIPSKHFALNMEIQNTFDHPNNPCRQTRVMLLGTEGVISIPLSTVGCVGELNLRLGEKLIDGTTNNLFAFGVDFARPVQLSCISVADSIEIGFDGKMVYHGPFENGIGQVVGVRIHFDGVGYIKNFNLN